MNVFCKIILFLFLSLNLFAGNINPLIKDFKASKEEIKNGAVILKRDISYSLDENNLAESTYYYLIALLDDKAINDYTHINFDYNSYFKDHKIHFARVISKDGKVNDLKEDALKIKGSNSNMYDDTKIIEFSLPNMKKGSFIEYKITLKDKKQIIKNNWFAKGSINKFHYTQGDARIDSLRNATIKVSIPKSHKLYTQIKNIEVKAKTKTTKNKKIYTWNFKNLKKYKYENRPEKSYYTIIPTFYMSTIKDWSTLNNQFNKDFSKKIVLNSKIKNLAKSITKNATTKQEKIQAVYNYLQKNIKYVFANLGSGGFTPHNTNEILENLYGDCKDQTILFISLLKALDIQAYPALVNSGSYKRFNKDIVSPLYFNHMISYVPSEDLWVDTTGPNFAYPGTSNSIVDKVSLIIKDKLEIKKITNTQNNEILIKKDYKLKDHYLLVDVNIKFKAETSNFLKSMYKTYNKNFLDNYETFIKRLYPKTDVLKFKFSNIDNTSEITSLNFLIKTKDQINPNEKINSILTYAGKFDSLLLDFSALKNLQKPSNIKYGLKLGVPLKIKVVENIVAPIENSKGTFSEIPAIQDTKYLKTTFKSEENSNNIKITRTYEIKNINVEQKDYKNFYDSINKLLNKSLWLVEYKYDPFFKKQASLKSKDDLESKIKLAKSYLDSMQIEKAREVLKEHVDKNPKNYELNYTYGIILGLIGEDDLSDKYLELAEKIK